ncbi:MAG: exodeoxyribonuclease III [Acidiphilium sp.]|nr:exodeoxyribonuclease III [Acidiphilium sp.]MDD4935822.1 exodeoxyribonuclease III [Acidiphilium sp.]
MKIVTWNVNSVRTRAKLVADFLTRERPDLLLLQEIKCEAHQFPAEVFAAAGYQAEVVGQKSYHGVAVLSREAVTVRERSLPGEADDAASRYIEVGFRDLIIGNLYLPNGNSGGEDGYRAKLAWMANLRAHAARLLEADRDFVLAGDYNVCPTDADYAKGALGVDDALVRPESRAAFRALIWLGLTDAVRALHPRETIYTFWDYQAGAWQRDRGLRIDHALLSPRVAERLEAVSIAKAERDKPQPSDHVPVVVEIGV